MEGTQRRPLKVGILLPVAEYRLDGRTPRWSDLLAMARLAEDAGFDSVWVVDHLLVRAPGQPPEGVWECWSLVSALAASTRRIRIGTLVVCANWRNPALLAKMAETVDEISGGRLILGLGAGNTEDEFRAFGFRWEERVSRFAEAIQIIHALLRQGHVDFEGRYYQARGCELRPRGPRPSGPPILVGGYGRRMLELAARYADLWNTYYSHTGNRASGVAPLSAAVDAACVAVSRDPATLDRTASVLVGLPGHGPIYGVAAEPLSGSPEELAGEFRAYARAGISHLQLRIEPNTPAGIEQVAPVLALLDQGER
jgi:probable F420-dependent oxidoreductase